jgi:hypothetical protein
MKDLDPTPRGTNEQWRFTPSLLDPSSMAFAAFVNQTPGYYTPTPGGTNTVYHNMAGDLHTPHLGIGVGTPLSMPTSDGAMHSISAVDLHSFAPQSMHSNQFQHFNPFQSQHQQQQSFAPHHFTQHHDMFSHMHDSGAHSGPEDGAGDIEMGNSPGAAFSSHFDSSNALSALQLQTATDK